MVGRSAHAAILESKLRKRILHTLWRQRTNSISTHSVGSDPRSVSDHLSIDQLLYKLQLGTGRQVLHCQQPWCFRIRKWENLWKPRLPSGSDNWIQQRIRIYIWLFIQHKCPIPMKHKCYILSINKNLSEISALGSELHRTERSCTRTVPFLERARVSKVVLQ